ncbi:MAG: hypothetical protein ACJAW2_000666 [Shewanella sp.]
MAFLFLSTGTKLLIPLLMHIGALKLFYCTVVALRYLIVKIKVIQNQPVNVLA